MMLATKNVEFKIINGLSFLASPTINQLIDPKLKKMYPAKIKPNATRKAPTMLVRVPKYASFFIVPLNGIC